jgi:hypothetical protein
MRTPEIDGVSHVLNTVAAMIIWHSKELFLVNLAHNHMLKDGYVKNCSRRLKPADSSFRVDNSGRRLKPAATRLFLNSRLAAGK